MPASEHVCWEWYTERRIRMIRALCDANLKYGITIEHDLTKNFRCSVIVDLFRHVSKSFRNVILYHCAKFIYFYRKEHITLKPCGFLSWNMALQEGHITTADSYMANIYISFHKNHTVLWTPSKRSPLAWTYLFIRVGHYLKRNNTLSKKPYFWPPPA